MDASTQTRVNAILPTKLVAAARAYGGPRNITLTELLRTALKNHLVEILKEQKSLPESLKNV